MPSQPHQSTKPTTSLKWPQILAWRLEQHGLASHFKHRDFVNAANVTGGIQAQVMSAAELGFAARVDGLKRDDIQTALWQDRTLVKTWAMRGTLHLLSSDELPLYAAARGDEIPKSWSSYFAYFGLSSDKQLAMLNAVPELLDSEPMTREELASAIAKQLKHPEIEQMILASSWGSPLKLSAFRGELCFGPNRGKNVAFVNPQKWLKNWKTIDSEEALQEIIRRYLQAYGPSTIKDFSRWWFGGSGLTLTKKMFQALDNELEMVEVEGRQLIALKSTIEPIQQAGKPNSVNLLPLFDAYTFGFGRSLEPILAKAHEAKVFRPQGWISAVVLVNGVIKGVWDYKVKKSDVTLTITPFESLSAAIKKKIDAEAEHISVFLNNKVSIIYS
jgi:hypothetical protein